MMNGVSRQALSVGSALGSSNGASFFPRFCLCGLARNQELLSDFQFARVLDLIEREQIVIRNF